MPLYEVKIAGQEKPRLIKASTPGGARNFATKSGVTVAHADAERAYALAADGVVLEDAGAEGEVLPPQVPLTADEIAERNAEGFKEADKLAAE